jgi:hypothetical protein
MTREELNDLRVRSFGSADVIAFICECEDEECRRSVPLGPDTFEARRKAGEAILYPGHLPLADAPVIAERAFVARFALLDGQRVGHGSPVSAQ